ncbi:MAG: hypothetical protein H6977_20180 [Gammaproteobacteria bacterium]|nr:hypothetical protein [Gammaproteobacteria bacterium]MCP5202322.1 hypothetical protein [Gammaproteobacteria bacterium]
MSTSLLRTFQVCAALFVLAVVGIAILVVTDLLAFDAALRIARNVGAVLAIVVVGAAVLAGLFGLGRARGDDSTGSPR